MQSDLRVFIVLSMPAILTYPMQWIDAHARPGSFWWNVTQYGGWLFLLSPVAVIVLSFMLPRFQPWGGWQKWTAIGLLVLNIAVALTSIPVLSMIGGL